jgi:hypothetical protein
VQDDQTGEESPHSISPSQSEWGIAFSDSKKAEALADSLEAQFQPVTIHSVPGFIEMVDVALGSYFETTAREPKLIGP